MVDGLLGSVSGTKWCGQHNVTETMRCNIYFFCCSRKCKSRDLVLALESTGCFDACVKNSIIICFWVYSQN